MASLIQSLEVSYLVHLTEDEGRIGSAVKETLGIDGTSTREELAGHFGNRIVHVVHRLTGVSASAAFEALARRLPPNVRKDILGRIEEMLDDHSTLYLRLDKQSLMQGEIALEGSEPVRVRVKPRLFLMKGGASGFFRSLLEGPA